MSLKKEEFAHIRAVQIQATKSVNNLFEGLYRSCFKGRGLEFAEVKEYFAGDDVRAIDWKTSARFKRTYVKSYKEERQLTVFLVVDISQLTQFGHAAYLKSEVIANIGAILAFSAIKNHDRVGLLLYSDQIELFLKPKSGVNHVLRCIREILYFPAKKEEKNLSTALSFFNQVQKERTICFLISDFIGQNCQTELSILSKRHEVIAIQVYDLYEKELPNLGLLVIEEMITKKKVLIDTSNQKMRSDYREASLQQQQSIKKLMQQAKVELLSLNVQQDYLKALHLFFAKRKR